MKSIRKINKELFNGEMNKDWKKYIKTILKKYRFDDIVNFTLFEYCRYKGHLEKEYISVVAESWYKNKIITNEDLENYFIQCLRLENIKRKMKRYMGRKINSFEEYYIEKWLLDCNLSERDILSVFRQEKNFDKMDNQLMKLYDAKNHENESRRN